MNTPAVGLRAAGAIFGLMALGHLIRVIAHLNLEIHQWHVARRWSVAAVVLLAALSVWMWTLAAKAAKTPGQATPTGPAA